jgi:hypothetical protein
MLLSLLLLLLLLLLLHWRWSPSWRLTSSSSALRLSHSDAFLLQFTFCPFQVKFPETTLSNAAVRTRNLTDLVSNFHRPAPNVSSNRIPSGLPAQYWLSHRSWSSHHQNRTGQSTSFIFLSNYTTLQCQLPKASSNKSHTGESGRILFTYPADFVSLPTTRLHGWLPQYYPFVLQFLSYVNQQSLSVLWKTRLWKVQETWVKQLRWTAQPVG